MPFAYCEGNGRDPARKTAGMAVEKTRANLARPGRKSKKNGQLWARLVGPGPNNEKEHTP